MSTPVVAGAAAMARQYFREGWYNTGAKNTSLAFDPSAALIKSVLVNSAVGMDFAGVNPATSSIDITLDLPPDTHQVRARVCFEKYVHGIVYVCILGSWSTCFGYIYIYI